MRSASPIQRICEVPHTISGERVRSGGSLTRPLLLAAVLLAVPAAGFAVCWAAAKGVVE